MRLAPSLAPIEIVSRVFELVGVAIILVGFVVAGWQALVRLRRHDPTGSYTTMRATFGRAVLLGLEVLVAADIIRTVALQPSLQNLAILAGLVLIRTFLSWSLTVEIDGRWPWQAARETPAEAGPSRG